jgi:putative spermidine/putrescine transport system permease protein
VLVVGLLLPFVPLVLWAVAGSWPYPRLLPESYTARAGTLLADPASEITRGLVTSTVIAVAVAVVAGLVGLCAGRALGLYRFRGKRLVQFLMLAPIIVPALAVTMGIQVLFIRYGLADTMQGVALVHLIPTVPYVTLVMSSVFANYEVAYEEQARVLGAGPLRILRTVTLPAVFPGLAVACLFAFIISWSEYILTLLVGGGAVTTMPLLLFAYIGGNDVTLAAALGLVFIVPPLLLLALTSRYLTGGQRTLTGLGQV